ISKAARNIETLPEDIEKAYERGGTKALMEIPGVGEGIAKKIEEYLKKGEIAEYEELKRGMPRGVDELMLVPGMGPKKAMRLHRELKVDSIGKLEKAAREGKIRKLEGFGEKSEQDILRGIDIVRRGQERMLLGRALPLAYEIVGKLKKCRGVENVEIAGSLRRRKETIGDIDILAMSNRPERVMDFFTSLPDVESVLAKGGTKSSVMLKGGVQCDLRVLEPKVYGAALMYFTGSKDHNVALRTIAIGRGMKLSEYGLFDSKTGKVIAARAEEEIYKRLGLPYLEPETRENTGELEAARKGKLPDLIKYNSIKGDLHMHTAWSDGQYPTEEMVKAAIRMGYEYIAITDHSKSTYVAHGLDEKRLLQRLKEIDAIQKKYSQIRIFKGAEIDILANGSLDYSNKTLEMLDVVIGSVHSGFKSAREEMTKRIIKAIENPRTNIIAHPTGRLIGKRDPYQVDMEKVFDAARANNVLLEVNAYPERLDLKDLHIRAAIEHGCRLVINTDSHSIDHLRFMELGIAQARRGWAGEKDVVNALSVKKIERILEKP
ncbi:MAG: DNA polymerase/3'-5' exonuclease PolX, partial [Candidatus Aenigmarchaeota archaeon]|nr:DNA polymerase/3'-5' exonuclease PolX [Candidatus Aenigmarchaeota archaeon]